jgi:universal stress protein E
MQLFTNILVGVDLARYDPFKDDGLNPSVFEPIHWGMQLAKTNSARLLFFAASNLNDGALSPLGEEDRTYVLGKLFQGGDKVLEYLVQEAQKEGIEAQSKLVPGEGWLEIIHQVLRGKHDLVVVGTRALTNLGHILFGNTSIKLLRRCPCPVLVTKPMTYASGVLGAGVRNGASNGVSPLNILVATNLHPPADQVLNLGVALAKQMNAQLNVLHVVEYELQEVCNIGLPDAKQEDTRRKVREHAQETLMRELEKTDYKSLGSRVEVHLAGDVILPDVAIKRFIDAHQIHLLIMGTIGRGGIRGIMIGNTAERLLHEVHASVLAVKPPDFVCPIEEKPAG